MAPGSPMSRETLLRLSDTGLTVRDVEFLQLRPDTGPDDWMPALEAGAALGASTFSVVGVDPDRARLTATLARLTADAAPYGIRPTLEPISYQPVSRVADAAAVARAAGAAVLLDALHIQRGGSSIDDVRALEPSLVPCVQICDGPLATPESLELPAQLPLGMTADGSVLQVEARALREVPGEGEFPLGRAARRRAVGHADQRRGPERHADGAAVAGRVRGPQPARSGGPPCGMRKWTSWCSAPARAAWPRPSPARRRGSRRSCWRRPSGSAAPPPTPRAPAGSRTTASSAPTASPTTTRSRAATSTRWSATGRPASCARPT